MSRLVGLTRDKPGMILFRASIIQAGAVYPIEVFLQDEWINKELGSGWELVAKNPAFFFILCHLHLVTIGEFRDFISLPTLLDLITSNPRDFRLPYNDSLEWIHFLK